MTIIETVHGLRVNAEAFTNLNIGLNHSCNWVVVGNDTYDGTIYELCVCDTAQEAQMMLDAISYLLTHKHYVTQKDIVKERGR